MQINRTIIGIIEECLPDTIEVLSERLIEALPDSEQGSIILHLKEKATDEELTRALSDVKFEAYEEGYKVSWLIPEKFDRPLTVINIVYEIAVKSIDVNPDDIDDFLYRFENYYQPY